MPFVLRKLDKRNNWWPSDLDQWPSWLRPDDIQADAISELRTSSNTLSVWHIEDDKSNLEQVVCAMAASRDSFADIHFILLDPESLKQKGFKLKVTNGATPDKLCNSLWHRDIVELTAAGLLELAKLIYGHQGSGYFLIRKPKIETLLQEGFQEDRYDRDRMKEPMVERLERRLR